MGKALRYLSPHERWQVVLAVALIFVQVWLDLTLPDFMANITSLVETPGSQMAEVAVQGAWMLACALGSMAANLGVTYLAARIAAGLGATLRRETFNHALELSKGDASHFGEASLVNRCTNDVTQVQNFVSMGLNAIVKAPVMAVWAVVKIVGYGWQWSLATAVAAIAVAIMLAFTVVFAVPRFQRMQSLTDTINRLVREHLQGIRPVHAYNAETFQQDRFRQANDDLTHNNLVAYKVMAIMNPGMTLVTSVLTLAIYWIGAYLIQAAGQSGAAGEAARLSTYSQMVVFSNYAMQVILACLMLNLVFVMLPRAQVAARRIMEVIETKSTIVDGPGASGTPNKSQVGTVEFRDVSFSYPDGTRALEHVSFVAHRGQTVAFIGATGSGKTTLVQLVDRLYDATEGQVLVDGIDVCQYRLDDLRSRVGYVPQTATLLKGTVKSNLSYGWCTHTVAEKDIRLAADVAQATEFVNGMPGGFEAPIEQGGRNVSGGQRQRLAMARAIARRPEVLVFDDSFSALDFATDKALRQALQRECSETTKLVVAQRVGTIRHADQIVVLEAGRVVGQGTHDELMQNCPTYQEIVSSQLSSEEVQHA